MRGWFVTGTDTGVGKTAVAGALVRRLVASGLSCAVMKPVASGCERVEGELCNADAQALRTESNVEAAYADVNPYAFEPAIAPHIAAGEARRTIDFDRILASFARLTGKADRIVVEGAGGWLVPLGAGRTQADLAAALALPAILVVGLRLGCLNHALLSAAAITARGVPLAGWVANETSAGFSRAVENRRTLESELPAPLLGHVPFCRSGSPIAHAGRHLDLAPLDPAVASHRPES